MNPLTTGLSAKEILGVPVYALTQDEVLNKINETISRRGHLHIGVVNAAKMVNMRRNEALKKDVLSSDLILADGMAVVWASRLLGCALPERVTGIDLMMGMLRQGNEHGYRIFCLGATDEVLEKVVTRITDEYPHVKLVGKHSGYFKEEEEPTIVAEIVEMKPDILLVAMTSPKKENFLARWSDQLGVPICHGVGGSFDVLAGKVQRAPETWQRLGLEWLYRVTQEPTRLWKRYLVTNTLFCLMVFRQFFKSMLDQRRK